MPAASAPPVRTASRRARSAAFVALAALVLAGCVAPKQQTTPTAAPSSTKAAEPDTSAGAGQSLDTLYAQKIQWEDCGDGFQCTTVTAPLDWAAPESGTIDLAVKRSRATGSADQRIGSLLIDPGGPGESGIGFLADAVGFIGKPVLQAYDIIGFDPRGVGQSTAVSCGDDASVDAFLTADVNITDQASLDAATAAVRAFGESCAASTGPLLGKVDTVNAARDMDLLRAVLGDDVLHYAGFSYGTFLGAMYAELYPDKVGRMVLDGAVDPSIGVDDLVIGQAEGFESAMRAYVADCQAGSKCPLTGGVDAGMQQVADLIERAGKKPIPAGGGAFVNKTLAVDGIIVTLYNDQSWPYLTSALSEAIQNNTAATLLALANFYLQRNEDGTYQSNSMVAFTAINCLDYPTPALTYDEMLAFADKAAAKAPTFGRVFAMTVGCEAWPVQSTAERAQLHAAGAAPIVVIGTTGDPATPYQWAVSLAGQLESGHLLTWKGEGHTAYGRSNACIGDAVDSYLVDGTVPKDGLTC